MIDGEALFSELVVYPAVAVAAPVLRVYGLDPNAFVCVAVRSLAEIVIVLLVAQFSDDLGPTPNISAFSSWSRAFNFFR